MFQRRINFCLLLLLKLWLRLQKRKASARLITLGSQYGGWAVPEDLLKKGAVAICAGAGEDISFDIELNSRGLKVYVQDPTPRARKHVESLLSAYKNNKKFPVNNGPEIYDLTNFNQGRFHFDPVGIAGENGVLKFYVPTNPNHVSHSIKNLQNTDQYFEAECVTYDDYLDSKGIEKVDIVKLDIEGAEHEVIDCILQSPRKPSVLAVDFDELNCDFQLKYFDNIVSSLAKIKKSGYNAISIKNSDFVFEKQAG